MILGSVSLVLLLAFGAPAQERAPSGEVYRELEPFVGLEGVRLAVHGFEGGFWHSGGPEHLDDPEAELTGFTRAQHEEMEQMVLAAAKTELERQGVPLLKESLRNDRRPTLTVAISWIYEKPRDTIMLRAELSLSEPAVLIREPGRLAMAPTWTVAASLPVTRQKLPGALQGFVRNYVSQFGELYRRAHSTSRREQP